MSSAKVGDRVRATYGENVIFGKVASVGNAFVNLDGVNARFYLVRSAWSIEVLAPPIADTYGTVVLDKDNDAWQRGDDGWYMADNDGESWSFDKLQKLAGPLTVLWTPVRAKQDCDAAPAAPSAHFSIDVHGTVHQNVDIALPI